MKVELEFGNFGNGKERECGGSLDTNEYVFFVYRLLLRKLAREICDLHLPIFTQTNVQPRRRSLHSAVLSSCDSPVPTTCSFAFEGEPSSLFYSLILIDSTAGESLARKIKSLVSLITWALK